MKCHMPRDIFHIIQLLLLFLLLGGVAGFQVGSWTGVKLNRNRSEMNEMCRHRSLE